MVLKRPEILYIRVKETFESLSEEEKYLVAHVQTENGKLCWDTFVGLKKQSKTKI